MRHFDINTPFKGNGWFKIKVNNKTTRTLSTGAVIPTWANMLRQALKSGK